MMNFNNQGFNINSLPISDGIVRHIDHALNQLLMQRKLDQVTASQISSIMKNNIGAIENDLRSFNRQINDNDIASVVFKYISYVIQQMQQQSYQAPAFQQQSPFMNTQLFNTQPVFQQQPFQTGAFQQPINSLNTSYTDKPGDKPAMENKPIAQNVKDDPPQQSTSFVKDGRILLAETSDHAVEFDFINDKNYLDYTVISKSSGHLVDVTSKAVIKDFVSDVNYASVDCQIVEPSPGRVISNFCETCPGLLRDKYIVDLSFRIFAIKRMKFIQNEVIDLSAFDKLNDLPAKEIVSTVINNIEALSKSKADVLQTLIVDEFNDLIERFIRVESQFDRSFLIQELRDVIFLLNPDDSYRVFSAFPDYQSKIYHFFKTSVKRVIFKETQCGCFDTEFIAPELTASPRFIIRSNGLFERELDFSDPDMINAIKAKYTVFGINGNVVITNFVSNNLDLDFEQTMAIKLQRNRITSPLDYLIFNVWKGEPKTIIAYMTDKPPLVIKTGITLEGTPFIFKSTYDLNKGL